MKNYNDIDVAAYKLYILEQLKRSDGVYAPLTFEVFISGCRHYPEHYENFYNPARLTMRRRKVTQLKIKILNEK